MKAVRCGVGVVSSLALVLVGCSSPAPSSPPALPLGVPSPAASPVVSGSPGAAASPSAGALTTIAMSETGASPSNWPLYVGVAKGFLQDEGISVDNTIIGSSTTQTDALISGELNINVYTIDSVAKPVANGAPIKYVGTAEEIPDAQIVVAPDISSFADLKGKTLSAGSPLGYFDVVMRAMMAANGLQPTDYTTVSIGNSAGRITALQSGQIQGMIASAPDDAHAIALGYKSLGYVNQYLSNVEYNGYAVSGPWAQAHQSLLVAFLRAMQRSVDFIVDPANKDEALAIYNQQAQLQPADLDAIYAQMVTQQMLSRDQRPNPTAITNLLTLSVQNGAMPSIPPLNTWVDTTYLDQAEQSLGH